MVHGIKQNRMVANIRITRRTPGPGVDSISCLVRQDFLGKCVPPDTISWRTDFPLTLVPILPCKTMDLKQLFQAQYGQILLLIMWILTNPNCLERSK